MTSESLCGPLQAHVGMRDDPYYNVPGCVEDETLMAWTNSSAAIAVAQASTNLIPNKYKPSTIINFKYQPNKYQPAT